ncbi:MAG: beta-ketoacyl-ACP synthase II, partial [Anaerovoracaceae bacterium]
KLSAEVKYLDFKEYMDFKEDKRMEEFSKYAVIASMEAFNQSGLNMDKEDPYRVGVSIGSGVGSLQITEKEHSKMLERGPSRVNPLLIPMMISNMAAGNVSIKLGLKGKSINVVTACATGTHSIGEAFRTITYGDADVMVAGGTEGAVTGIAVSGFGSLTALTTSSDKTRASIPFDQERSGFVLGEGAGILVLEELEHAKARGANILGEIVGYGATSDSYHITSPAEDGSGAAKSMEFAMKDANIGEADIDYINAHGTSTPLNDLFETRAIKLAFPNNPNKPLINSTKSMIGHLLGAAGAVEAIVCLKSIEEGFIHNTVGTKNLSEECDLNYVIGGPVKKDINYAMSNSLGFGGHNGTLIFKKYEV